MGSSRSRVNRIRRVFLLVTTLVGVALCQEQCTFESGDVFNTGEPVGSNFVLPRCGDPADFPCFCDPTAERQVNCPYCGIPTNNEEGLTCIPAGEPRVFLVNPQGVNKECICRLTLAGTPESFCIDAPDAVITDPPVQTPTSEEGCTLEWSDGAVDFYEDGDSYGDLFSTECGPPSEYPCFCDVTKPDKINCPYCGVATNTGALACGREEETFILVNELNEEVSCFCQTDLVPNCVPTALGPTEFPSALPATQKPTLIPTIRETPEPTEAIVTDSPTIFPRLTPEPTVDSTTISPVMTITDRPTTAMPSLAPTSKPSVSPSIAPQQIPTTPFPTLDKPSLLLPSRTPPISNPDPGCYFEDANGEEQFLKPGEAFEGLLEGPCSPQSAFPALCNPDLPGQVEYPYCVFTLTGTLSLSATTPTAKNTNNQIGVSQVDEETGTIDGNSSGSNLIICAKSGDRVSVPTTTGRIEACSCLYVNPFIGPVSSCPEQMASVPLALTESPTTNPSLSPSETMPTMEPSIAPASLPTSQAESTQAGFLSIFLISMIPILL